MILDFNGKVVMITGGGGGIGAELCKRFASYGAAVGIAGRRFENIDKVRQDIEADGGKAMAIQCDVTDEVSVKAAVEKLNEAYGKIDILVNNAAVFVGSKIDEMSHEDWRKPMDVILDGTFHCCKHVLPGMKERRYGKIVSMCSAAVNHPFPEFTCYAAAKSGLIGFNNTMQEEVRPYNINTNIILLGLTNTEEVQARNTIPAEEMLQTSDVANLVTFLCSEEGRGFKGASLEFYGDHV